MGSGRTTEQKAVSKADHLKMALHSNRVIGIAIGIPMSFRQPTDAEAFNLLRETSPRSNRKLRDIAEDVIFAGTV